MLVRNFEEVLNTCVNLYFVMVLSRAKTDNILSLLGKAKLL